MRDVPWYSLNIDSINADPVVPVTIKAVKYLCEHLFFLLLNNRFTLLIFTSRISAFVILTNILVFLQLFLAVFEPVVVFIKNHASRITCIVSRAWSSAEIATIRISAGTAPQLTVCQRLKCAVSVKIASFPPFIYLVLPLLLQGCLSVKTLGCSLARSSFLSHIERSCASKAYIVSPSIDLRGKCAIFLHEGLLYSLMAKYARHRILVQQVILRWCYEFIDHVTLSSKGFRLVLLQLSFIWVVACHLLYQFLIMLAQVNFWPTDFKRTLSLAGLN